MAILLGIGKSQWSIYESGTRNIPLRASEMRGEMLVYMQSPDSYEARNSQQYKIETKL